MAEPSDPDEPNLATSFDRFRSQRLIDARHSALFLIDIQEKLLPAITRSESVVFNAGRLARGAEIMKVPTHASVQYPKGLGPLHQSLQNHFPAPAEKLDFSAAACDEIVTSLREGDVSQIIICGIETHICILQTTLDLLALQFDVFVVADAVSARGEEDHRIAIDRMQCDGATIVTTESVLFEWCQTAAHDRFKEISAIVRETP